VSCSLSLWDSSGTHKQTGWVKYRVIGLTLGGTRCYQWAWESYSSAHVGWLFHSGAPALWGWYSYNKNQQDALFIKFILVKNSTCFGQAYCPSSGVLTLYSQQLVFVIQLCWPSASEVGMEQIAGSRQSTYPVWQIPIAENTVVRLLMMDSKSVRNMYSSLPK
jgi:hypothetical protein